MLPGVTLLLQDGTNTYVWGVGLVSITDNGGLKTYPLVDGLGSTANLVDAQETWQPRSPDVAHRYCLPLILWISPELRWLCETAASYKSLIVTGPARIRSQLLKAASAIGAWTPFDELTAQGLVALFEIAEVDESLVKTVLDRIGACGFKTNAESKEETSPKTWVASYLRVMDAIRAKWPRLPEGSIDLACGVEEWCELCAELAAAAADPGFIRILKPQVAGKEIDTILAAALSEGNWGERETAALDVSREYLHVESWPNLLEAIETLIREESTITTRAAELTRLAWSLGETHANGFAKRLTEDGTAFRRFSKAMAEEDYLSAATFLLTSMQAPSVPESSAWDPSARTGFQLREAILTGAQASEALTDQLQHLLALMRWGALLFNFCAARPIAKPYVLASIQAIVSQERPWEIIEPPIFVRNASLIGEALKNQAAAFDRLVAVMCKNSSLLDEIKRSPFDMRLFDATAAAVGLSDDRFAEKCVAGLRESTRNSWMVAFRENSYPRPLQLLSKLKDANIRVELGAGFVEAFRAYLNALAEGGEGIRKVSKKERNVLWAALSSSQQMEIEGALLGKVIALGADVNPAVFDLFGDQIARPELLRPRSELLPRLFTPLVLGRKAAGVRWLRGVLGANSALLEKGFPRSLPV